MAYDLARMLLEKAKTPLDREKAVRVAMRLGMPLNEIEEYLDWVDMVRKRKNGTPKAYSRHKWETSE